MCPKCGIFLIKQDNEGFIKIINGITHFKACQIMYMGIKVICLILLNFIKHIYADSSHAVQ